MSPTKRSFTKIRYITLFLLLLVSQTQAASFKDLSNKARLQALQKALTSLKAQSLDDAQHWFQTFIRQLPPTERELYYALDKVATAKERITYASLPQNEQEKMATRLWNRYDPAPITRANERQLEHYRRVAFARKHFATDYNVWDDRGEVYVRLGPPAHISRSWDVRVEEKEVLLSARTKFATRFNTSEGIIPGFPTYPIAADKHWEYWVYPNIEGGVEFTFESPFPNSAYRFAALPELAQAETLPSATAHTLQHNQDPLNSTNSFERISFSTVNQMVGLHGELILHDLIGNKPTYETINPNPLSVDFGFSPVVFRSKNKQSQLDLLYGISASDAAVLTTNTKGLLNLDLGIVIYDTQWHEIERISDRISVRTPTDQQILDGAFLPGRKAVHLPPGTYNVAIQIQDPATKKTDVYRHTLEVEDYHTHPTLNLSDIEMAFNITPSKKEGAFTHNNLNIIPMPFQKYRTDQQAMIYFEVYNLRKDTFGKTSYRVEYTLQNPKNNNQVARVFDGLKKLFGRGTPKQSLSLSYDQVGSSSEENAYLAIDLSTAQTGTQKLHIEVTDLLTGQTTKKETQFTVLPY